MGHADIRNRTPFAFAPMFLSDEDGRPLFVPLVQATYSVRDGEPPALLDEQPEIDLAGVAWDDDPLASLRVEAPSAFTKPATDVVLVGHARAPHAGATESQVSLRVGPLSKTAAITGDRTWIRAAGAVAMTRPLPFEAIPLRWERAFGGWDRSAADPAQHTCDPQNPLGVGFRAPGSPFEEGIRLPNVEDPASRIERWGQVAPPVGFGFVLPQCEPRKRLAGTFDRRWRDERCPLLPADFDRRFFNAAPAGLVATGYLGGGEEVVVLGATPDQRLAFSLPELRRPACRVVLSDHREIWVEAAPDTVIVDADALRLTVLFRAHVALWKSVHEVHVVEVGALPRKGQEIGNCASAVPAELGGSGKGGDPWQTPSA